MTAAHPTGVLSKSEEHGKGDKNPSLAEEGKVVHRSANVFLGKRKWPNNGYLYLGGTGTQGRGKRKRRFETEISHRQREQYNKGVMDKRESPRHFLLAGRRSGGQPARDSG